LEYEWNRRVVNYNEDVQFEFFEKLFGQVTEQKILLLLMGLASFAILAVALSVIRLDFSGRKDPINRYYEKLSKELAKVGLARHKGEGPLDYRDRVIIARPELRVVMSELTAAYTAAMYQDKKLHNEALAKTVASLKRGIKKLKADLFKTASLSK
jgi:hypothetical protein